MMYIRYSLSLSLTGIDIALVLFNVASSIIISLNF